MVAHKKIRSFTATEQDLAMLQAVARYHGFSKSGTITSLIKKEFWRVFPAGTGAVRPDQGARVRGAADQRGPGRAAAVRRGAVRSGGSRRMDER
jgi:hypothetical protein